MAVIDTERLDDTLAKLERAGELLRTIRAAGTELDDLLAGEGIGIRLELEAGDLNGNGASAATVRTEPEDEREPPAPPPSPPRPDSRAGDPPSPAPEPPAAAPAAPTSPPPAPAPAKGAARRERAAREPRLRRRRRPERAVSLDAVRGAMRRLGHDWQATGQVAGEAGLSSGTTGRYLAELTDTGELEHNGKGGPHGRYRLVGPPNGGPDENGAGRDPARGQDDALGTSPAGGASNAPPAAEGALDDLGFTDDGDPPELEPADGTLPGDHAGSGERRAAAIPAPAPISPRVRRAIEREEADARERELERTRFIDRDNTGTFAGRVLEVIKLEPGGLRSLHRRLDRTYPDEELIATLVRLERDGDLIRRRNPDHSIGAETHTYEAAP